MAEQTVCPLGCGQPLHNGEKLIPWVGVRAPGAILFDEVTTWMVHASCAQELRGEAEG